MYERQSILTISLCLALSLLVHIGLAGGLVIANHDKAAIDEMPKPDLIAADVLVGEPRVAGQAVEFTAVIRLEQMAVDQPFAIEFFVDDQSVGKVLVDQLISVDSVVTRSIQYTARKAGRHRLAIEVDVDQQIDDLDRTNNRMERWFVWTEPDKKQPTGQAVADIDLKVEALDIPDPRIAGQESAVKITVSNLGKDKAPAFDIGIMVDDQLVQWVRVEQGLPAGKAVAMKAMIVVKKPGLHTVTVIADPQQAVYETNETNNQASGEYEWKPPKPTIGGDEDNMVVNLIDYDHFQQLMTRKKTLFDQPLAQMQVDPLPNAPAVIDNVTPPLPPQPKSNPTPPALAMDKQSLEQIQDRVNKHNPAKQQVTQLDQPKPTDQTDSLAPTMDLQRPDTASALAVNDPLTPTPIDPTSPDASQLTAAIDRQASEELAFDQVPFHGEIARMVERITQMSPDNPGLNPLMPAYLPDEKTGKPKVTAPPLKINPKSDPTNQSSEIKATEKAKPRLASTPVDLDKSKNPGSPEQKPTDKPADKNKTSQTKAKPDPKQPTKQASAASKQKPSSKPMVSNPTSAPKTDSESTLVSRVTGEKVVHGKVLTAKGIKIKTRRIPFSRVAQMTTAPHDPIVRVVFDKTGKVVRAEITRTSGYANIDGPVLNSLYRWKAEGKIKDIFVLEDLRIMLGVYDD